MKTAIFLDNSTEHMQLKLTMYYQLYTLKKKVGKILIFI